MEGGEGKPTKANPTRKAVNSGERGRLKEKQLVKTAITRSQPEGSRQPSPGTARSVSQEAPAERPAARREAARCGDPASPRGAAKKETVEALTEQEGAGGWRWGRRGTRRGAAAPAQPIPAV